MAKVNSSGKSHSAISVVNALATGKGSAIGIALKCTVKATLVPRSENPKRIIMLKSAVRDYHNLIEACKMNVERFLGKAIQKNKMLSISIDSEIPPAVGLKSSSAVSIACVKALSQLFAEKLDQKSILEISCSASKDSGASITGAYDDAAACLLGGLALTDNSKLKLLKHGRIPASLGNIVLIRLPKKEKRYTSSVDLKAYSRSKMDSLKAFDWALEGRLAHAMFLNSIIQCSALGYSFQPISSAIEEGASAAGISGKGPAVAALCKTQKISSVLEKRWTEETKFPITILKTSIVQPKRLLRN